MLLLIAAATVLPPALTIAILAGTALALLAVRPVVYLVARKWRA